jgi:hypothetical protein
MTVVKAAGVLATLAAVMVLAVAGCGGTTQPDVRTKYTAQGLAEELAFRVKALPAEAARPAPAATKGALAIEDVAGKREAEVGKKDPGSLTVEDIVSDIAVKARQVEGTSFADTCKQVADAVNRDTTIPEASRKAITSRLEALGREG